MQLGGTLSYTFPLTKKKSLKKKNLKVSQLIFGFLIMKLMKILVRFVNNKLDIVLNANTIVVERAIMSLVPDQKELLEIYKV